MTDDAGGGRPNRARTVEDDPAAAASQPRPLIERLGLGAIALLVTVLFGALGVAALASNEVFLGIMGLIGALMTVWAAAGSLRRG
ncbi:MAG: hypothetical protein QOI92_2047 [Chloroflexota bacterium]|jgi:hypothetical protein|nr:hypothetical protein [Chloroflexota bacterium]